jgi:beta-glucosidase
MTQPGENHEPMAAPAAVRRRRAGFVAPAAIVVLALVAGGCSSSDDSTEDEGGAAPTSEPTATASTPDPTATAEPPAIPEPAPASLAPAATPGETYFAPFPVSITLDGDLSDWTNVPVVAIPPSAEVVIGSTSVDFAAAADDEFLYLMGDVTDSRIVTGQHGTDYWNEDSVEFYINGTGNLLLTSYTDGVAQITVPALNAGRPSNEVVIGGIRGDTAEAEILVTETPDGYAIEMAVPLKNRVWNIPREHGSSIGFQVHLNSASEGDRDLKVIWSNLDTSDTSYLNPGVFGTLRFFEIGETDIDVEAPEADIDLGPPVPPDAVYKQADRPIDERVDDLLARMSLAEKIAQMTLVEKNSIVDEDLTRLGIGGLLSGGGGSPDENTPAAWAAMVDGFQEHALASRLGIPLLYGVDAVHGHNNVRGAVIFPHNIGLGAANDVELMQRIGEVTAAEMIATGIYWNYAPAVSVPRDIRWGRTYEGYSEDTEVVSELAAAYLQGLQGADLADPTTVLATPKHFVGDGGTAWGSSTTGSYLIDQGVTEVDEETLRAVHLPPYTRVLESGAESIMVSYSSFDDLKMHAHEYMITDVLKDELGFDGFVLSDWGAIDQISNDYDEAVATAINAGVDMNMVPYDYTRFIRALTSAVESDQVSEGRIDDAVRRILTVKFALGLFENAAADRDLLDAVGSEPHRALARQAVAQSQVLLQNDGELLPLPVDVPLLLVGGAAADDIGIQSGGWTIEWQGSTGDITDGTTILDAIEATVSADTIVQFDPFGRFDDRPVDRPAICLAVVGERPYAEGFGDDDELTLPVSDIRMLRRMADVCDKIAVVLLSGRPLIVTDLLPEWDALVAGWLPGTEGHGVADVVFGLAPFTGTLPYTWPRTAVGLPQVHDGTGEAPLFPLRFGLTTG